MIKNTAITLLDESEPLKADGTGVSQIIETNIEIGDQVVPFRIGVPDQEARLSEMVPLAHAICTRLSVAIIDDLEKNNTPIACRKGCSACCSYLITLSFPEIFYLQEMLSSMPRDYHRSILQSCLESTQKILRSNATKPEMNHGTVLDLISRWYAGLDLTCPFLSDGSCGIYDQRPLACREYWVTNSSDLCQNGLNAESGVVTLPVSVLEALGQLAAEFEQSEVEAVALPLAFISTDDYFERSEHTWPAIDMVKRFVEIIEEMASQHSQLLMASV